MHITATREALVNVLAACAAATDRKSTMPILGNVLVRAQGKGTTATTDATITIAATDLTVALTCHVEGEVHAPGAITLSGKTFAEIVKSMPAGSTVSIDTDDRNYATISAGKVQMKLAGLAAQDFPKIASVVGLEGVMVDSSTLLRLIHGTSYAIAQDESRYHLSGANFDGAAGHLRMVATDGHRLAICARDTTGEATVDPALLIPRRALPEVKRVCETLMGAGEDSNTISLAISKARDELFIALPTATLWVKLVNATFPPYEMVIPKTWSVKAQVAKDALLDACRRCKIISGDSVKAVKLAFMDATTLSVEADNPDLGEASEQIEAAVSVNDGATLPLAIGMNATYLLDALNGFVTEHVTLEAVGQLDPLVMRPAPNDGDLVVIMPVRI